MAKEIRRVEKVPHATEDDFKIAEKMEKKGVPIPENLRAPYEEYKAQKNGGQPPKKEEPPKPAEEPKAPPVEPEKPKGSEADKGGAKQPEKPVGSEGARPVRYIPVKEFKDKEDAWKSREGELVAQVTGLEQTIEKLNSKKAGETSEEWKARVAKVAEKTGFAPDDIEAIASLFRGETDSLPAKTEKKVEAAAAPEKPKEEPKPPAEPVKPAAPQKTKEQLDADFWKEQDDQFDADFAAALKEPGADPTMADRKEAIKKAAFTAGNEKKSLWEIDTRIVKPKADKAKKSPDSPGGIPGGGTGEAADFDSLAADPVKQREFLRTASIDQKEKFTEYMGRRGQGSKVRRGGKPLN